MNNKKLYLVFLLAFMGSSPAFSQVGIGTKTPKATLDVVGKPADATALDGIIAPRLTGDQLQAKTYTADQTGTQVYVTAAATSPAGQTVNVTAPGNYYYNGTVWVAVASGSSTTDKNIYDADGTVTGNRTVTQNGNNLTFSGAGNLIKTGGNVGIGTSSPISALDIRGVNWLSSAISLGNTAANEGQAINFAGDARTYGLGSWNSSGTAASTFFIFDNTAGATRIAVAPSGNVGIGTAAPTDRLQVAGGSVRINDLGGAGTQMVVVDNGGLLSRQAIPSFVDTNTNIYNADGVLTGPRFVNQNGNPLTFNGGYIGLGTFSPDASLEVANFMRVRPSNGAGDTTGGYLELTGGSGVNTGVIGFHRNDNVRNGYIGFDNANMFYNSENGANHIFGGGNVGIGTTAPSSKLQIGGIPFAGNANDGLTLSSIDNQWLGGFYMKSDAVGVPRMAIETIAGSGIKSEIISMPVGGNVGIGTTSPSSKLQIGGLPYVGNLNDGLTISTANNEWLGGFYMKSDGGGTPRMAIETITGFGIKSEIISIPSTGNVGIGTTAPTTKLDVVGNARISDLGGAGAQMVVTDNNGVLSRQAIPSFVDTNTNIYNADGVLTGPRFVNQNGNPLTFNGGYVGLGTFSPDASLEVANFMRVRPSNGAGDTSGGYLELTGGSGVNTGVIGFHRNDGTRNGYIGYDNANMLYATENGANHVFAGGNVGIGTSTPDAKLAVIGDIRISQENSSMTIGADGNSDLGFVKKFGFQPVIASGSGTPMMFGSWSTANMLGNVSTGSFNERMRIDTNGNVGIGTTAPTSKLQIGGIPFAPNAKNGLTLSSSGNEWVGGFYMKSDGGGIPRIAIETINNTEIISLPSTGNVGIGTTAPIAKLDIAGYGGLVSYAGTNLGNEAPSFFNAARGSGQLAIGINMSNFNSEIDFINTNATLGGFRFMQLDGTANTVPRTLITIAPSGYMGIGITTPNAPLHIDNTVGSPNRKIVLFEDSPGTEHDFYGFGVNTSTLRYQSAAEHAFFTANTTTSSIEVMRINGGGNVGIGTSNPSAKLHVIGNVIATGGYADYVLENYVDGTSVLNAGYTRKSLEEVDQFIKTNKHLPGVTSVKDLKIASNGEYEIDITKLQVQLLEKVEELYLHTIEQQKQMKEQQKQIDALKAELSKK